MKSVRHSSCSCSTLDQFNFRQQKLICFSFYVIQLGQLWCDLQDRNTSFFSSKLECLDYNNTNGGNYNIIIIIIHIGLSPVQYNTQNPLSRYCFWRHFSRNPSLYIYITWHCTTSFPLSMIYQSSQSCLHGTSQVAPSKERHLDKSHQISQVI